MQGTISIRVRYPECDPMSFAHHSAFLVWFEMGRTELARDAGLRYRDMEEAGAFLAVVDLKVRYRSPARYDDELTLTTTVARATRVKLIHTYELMRDGVLLATGETTIACLDRDGKPTLMPDILTKLHD